MGSIEYGGGNRVLDGLPEEDWSLVKPLLDVFLLSEESLVQAADRTIQHVYFPLDAILSIVVQLRDGEAFEVAAVGSNGAVGLELLIGAEVAPRTVLCQVSGQVARMKREAFSSAVNASQAFFRNACTALRRQIFVSQQTVACNAAHADVERTARWILMMQDQMTRDRFRLRLEYLGMMLGLTAGDVLEPIRQLETRGAIRFREGVVRITSQSALRECACECYAAQSVAVFIDSSFLTADQSQL